MDLLHTISLYKKNKNGNNNRLGFPAHYCCVFGPVRARFKGRVELSLHSRKYPDVYEALKNMDVPIPYTSIQINKNLVCPKHIDKGNIGLSYIISIGDYVGGDLVVDGIAYDTRQGLIFDGSKEHYNTDMVGEKFSATFFTIKV
jgi:hypothetical protein